MQLTPPDQQSIFGDTYNGVPSPNRAYTSVYPNKYHGPIYTYPVFGPRYINAPYTTPLRQSVLTHFNSLGDDSAMAPLFASPTGQTMLDAVLGAAAGAVLASSRDRMMWAILGGIATGLAGNLGLVATVGAGIYNSSSR